MAKGVAVDVGSHLPPLLSKHRTGVTGANCFGATNTVYQEALPFIGRLNLIPHETMSKHFLVCIAQRTSVNIFVDELILIHVHS